MSRRLSLLLFGGLAPAMLLGSFGCNSGDDTPGDQATLQALLQDKDLTLSSRSALSTGAAGTTGTAGTTGGAGTGVLPPGSGAAGSGPSTTGAAGRGPIPTGAAGSVGPRPDGGVAGSGGSTDGGTAGTGSFPDGGVTGKAGAGGMMPPPPPPVGGDLGVWDFESCNEFRTEIFDSTFNSHTAFRSIGVQCAAGVMGLAAQLQKKEDIVYVPDQPDFTFEGGLTVGGWFNPTSVKQVRSLLRKRDQGTSAFALLLNEGNYQFVINLGGGRAASVSSPKKAKANTWAHVAGTYDNTFLRLYVDGVEVSKLKVKGAIAPGAGPLLMGNDGSERRLDGLIDTVVFSNRAQSADEILALTCLHNDPTVKATPAVSTSTLPGVPFAYDISIKNNNSKSCVPADFSVFPQVFIPGITVDTGFGLQQVPSGGTQHLTMTVTATDDPDPGTITIPFGVVDVSPGSTFNAVPGSVDFVLAPTGCRVSRAKELMITNLGVVDDPVRTTGSGVWTFKHLMEAMAPTPADAPAMVEAMLATFDTPQTFNSFTMDPRPGMQALVVNQWPRTPDGHLDLSQPRVQLEAIVNRFDLRNVDAGDAGEGRFVFGFLGPGGPIPLQATIILEYKLPATTDAQAADWAARWHALGALTQGTPEYNAALEDITERFAGRGARPSTVNGSAINAVRTNEITLGNNGRWELREFVLSPTTGTLVPGSIKLTPDLSFNNSATLASFINANQASIIAETHTVPDTFQGAPFVTGAVFNDLIAWTAPGINDNEARHHFSLNTCNGCHSGAETGTRFLMISPRFLGREADLAGFLTGITVGDPVTGQPRTFNDLARRATDLKSIVCPGSVTPPQPSPPPTVDGGVTPPLPIPAPPKPRMTTLRMGISRVH